MNLAPRDQKKLERVFEVLEVYEVPDTVKVALVQGMLEIFIDILKRYLENRELENMFTSTKENQ